MRRYAAWILHEESGKVLGEDTVLAYFRRGANVLWRVEPSIRWRLTSPLPLDIDTDTDAETDTDLRIV